MVNIVYSNSSCKDVLDLFVKQHEIYCQIPLHIISDYTGDYIYDNKDPYYLHWINALDKIDSDYFIYNQEDFLLYDTVNILKINYLKSFLENNPKYSFVRLIKSGTRLSTNMVDDNLYETGMNSFPLYSMQATLWNKHKFIELYNHTKQKKWFESDVYEKACRDLSLTGVYYYDGESRAGKNHHNSSIYPYVATAVIKGKWNIKEYGNILKPLLEKNNINIDDRGYV